MTNWIRRFMIGRYGTDQLNIALLLFGVAMSLLGQFFYNSWLVTLSYIPLLLCMFRILSRNLRRRQQENLRFLNVWNPFQHLLRTKVNRMKNVGSYKYFKCPNCKQELRVPRGKGNISITCPKCHTEFHKKS